jgi:phenylalanyl-tRNA synthetase beta chain
MDISLKWINRYLAPANIDADEADRLLTQAGFPIEGLTELPCDDTLLDVELTSNRGDCLCHVGCAREVAAMRSASVKRTLVMPEFRDPETAGAVSESLTLENAQPGVCPLFTARVIKGCQVGPSPQWLVDALESVGQRSINNVVDVTNFISLELGNPCHVFDLAKLAGNRLVIRYASEGEKLTTLDGKDRTLAATDLIVADAQRPASLAGVIGGQDSQVTEATTDVVFEMATWDPVTVRTASRRLNIRTDASHRFERGVHPATIEPSARRAVSLLCELTGGQLLGGILDEGAPIPESIVVNMRPRRVKLLLGVDIPVGDQIAMLRDLEIETEQISDDELRCTIPPHRLDLTREVDLIEEVARVAGLDAIPAQDKIFVRPRPLQASELAHREIARILTGLGFFETITFSFTSPGEAAIFLPRGLKTIEVDDDRRKAEPTLRPSVLTGLLACRRSNRDAGVDAPGGVRLYELAEAFVQDENNHSLEARNLTLLMDISKAGRKHTDDDLQLGLRHMRGALDALALAMFGPHARVAVSPCEPVSDAWHPQAHANLTIATPDGSTVELARFGLVSDSALKGYDLDEPMVAAEILFDQLIAPYPPPAVAARLPAFPGIERDLSLIVPEEITWAQIESLVESLGLEKMTGCAFVGTFRGKQIGAGDKSVTLRLGFRDSSRTLRHEEVDPQMDRVAEASKERLGAKIRA